MRAFHVLLGVLFLFSTHARASRTSYRNAHPIAWMHMLPVGETPGWTETAWINFELNHANVWNLDAEFRDKRTHDIYRYQADFEQSSAIFDIGFSLNERWAFSTEVAYANRSGGFLDDFIDQFHTLIGSDRFLRHLNDEYDNSYIVQVDRANRLATEQSQGIGNVKAKLKYWMWKWQSPTPGICDCGFALSAQAKFPTQARKFGLSSGTNDYSGLAHLGAPIFKYSAAWATAGVTKLGPNRTFDGWPRRDWQQMYELSLDLGVNESLGFLMQARAESPFFDPDHMEFQYHYTEPKSRSTERGASGWNSLTAWRGSQSIGMRWRWPGGSQANLLLIEDWGLGDRDNRGEAVYVNNAPDIALISQWHFVF